MITFDIEIFGTTLPLSISNKNLLKEFDGQDGCLIDFINLAIDKLKEKDNDIIKIELKKINEKL